MIRVVLEARAPSGPGLFLSPRQSGEDSREDGAAQHQGRPALSGHHQLESRAGVESFVRVELSGIALKESVFKSSLKC